MSVQIHEYVPNVSFARDLCICNIEYNTDYVALWTLVLIVLVCCIYQKLWKWKLNVCQTIQNGDKKARI